MRDGEWERICALMEAALSAAEHGWPVFPVVDGEKLPAVRRDWERAAMLDRRLIERRWRTAYNIGIAAGPARLVIVDLDIAKGGDPPEQWHGARHGRDVLSRLAADAGAVFPVPTRVVRTPSGGEHHYFQAPAEPTIRNSAGRIGWRVDIRGKGGYVLGPGSWLRSGGTYEVVVDAPVAELPPWLADLAKPPEVVPAPLAPLNGSPVRARGYGAAALRNEWHRVRGAPAGERHVTLLGAARRLGRLVEAGLLDEATVISALEGAAEHYEGKKKFGTIRDGIRYGRSTAHQARG
jgi:hypothetical protein